MAPDPLGPELVLGLDGASPLAAFNRAGVLAAVDVHVALVLARLGGEADPLVQLAVALAARAPRAGHVLADLATAEATVVTDARWEGAQWEGGSSPDITSLPWPPLDNWLQRLALSALVAVESDGPGTESGPGQAASAPTRPLRLVGTSLYLDRYWRDEGLVAAALAARAGARQLPVDEAVLDDGLARLFPEAPAGPQAMAAVTSLRRLLSVVVGGPGTGKTTTVARLLALLHEQAAAAGAPPPLVALAAPTGKAAARMAEALHGEAHRLEISRDARERLLTLDASTIHRLLGRNPASESHFRHDHNNRLPHDILVVDEASMVSLPLMARLVDAVRPEARLVLIGDHQQLASVEAGAVLADIVGPAGRYPIGHGPRRAGPVPSPEETWKQTRPISSCITVLSANHRFAGPLAELADAIRAGDSDSVIALLCASRDDPGAALHWFDIDLASAEPPAAGPVLEALAETARSLLPLLRAARDGDAAAALGSLGRLRLLCAHRSGPAGASTWNMLVERWLTGAEGGLPGPRARSSAWAVGNGAASGAASGGPEWYPGRPVVVTENDYSLGLFNGDTGVAISRGEGGGLTVAFQKGTSIVTVAPSRVAAIETAFAMTAHRAQGSEFDEVVVLLPTASRVLTRELLYT
ncbi:MAG: exodeoxyribonuclease V subunit alpha, partial [Acidimicrobiales bacterium]